MQESERLERWKHNYGYEECGIFSTAKDEEISNRIIALLNHPKIDKYCMVDAYYYDFSVIPEAIQKTYYLCRDAYLIFGITNDGEIVSKWVDRWDLDCSDPVANGVVIRSERSPGTVPCAITPEVRSFFDKNLLSTPAPDFIKLFRKT